MTTIVTPAANTRLTTLERAKRILGISVIDHDKTLDDLILAASAAAEKFCCRVFREERVKEPVLTRWRSPSLMVGARLPVTTIHAITTITPPVSTFDSDNYRVTEAAAGIIISLAGPWPSYYARGQGLRNTPSPGDEYANIEVEYTGGYTLPSFDTGTWNLPADVEQAVIMLISTMFSQRSMDQTVKTIGVPDGATVTFRDGGSVGTLAPAYQMLLPYRLEA